MRPSAPAVTPTTVRPEGNLGWRKNKILSLPSWDAYQRNSFSEHRLLPLPIQWRASLVPQTINDLPAMWETWVQFPDLGRFPGEGSTPVFLSGEFHGQRSLADYNPWVCRVEQDWSNLACTHLGTSDNPVSWEGSYWILTIVFLLVINIYFF